MNASDRLKKVIEWSGLSAASFAKKVKPDVRVQWVYDILKEKKTPKGNAIGISTGLISLIVSAFPQLNPDFLLRGTGPMTIENEGVPQESSSMIYDQSGDCEREVEELKREVSFLKSQLESEREKNALKDQLIEMLKSSDESSKRKVKKNADNFS